MKARFVERDKLKKLKRNEVMPQVPISALRAKLLRKYEKGSPANGA